MVCDPANAARAALFAAKHSSRAKRGLILDGSGIYLTRAEPWKQGRTQPTSLAPNGASGVREGQRPETRRRPQSHRYFSSHSMPASRSKALSSS